MQRRSWGAPLQVPRHLDSYRRLLPKDIGGDPWLDGSFGQQHELAHMQHDDGPAFARAQQVANRRARGRTCKDVPHSPWSWWCL